MKKRSKSKSLGGLGCPCGGPKAACKCMKHKPTRAAAGVAGLSSDFPSLLMGGVVLLGAYLFYKSQSTK